MRTDMTKRLWVMMVTLLGLAAPAASAALLETRSNYVGPDWTGSWSNIANWSTVTPYSSEPGDGGGDINYIAMAHDDTYLYINFNQQSGFAYDHGNQQISFDTDLNAATGNTTDFWWWGAPTGVGAEHTMYGSAIWDYPETSWDGDSVDNWSYYGTETGDILIQINRSQLGNPAAFNFVGRMFGTDDYYPNVGNWHQYVVPEPAGAALIAVMGAGTLLRRRNR